MPRLFRLCQHVDTLTFFFCILRWQFLASPHLPAWLFPSYDRDFWKVIRVSVSKKQTSFFSLFLSFPHRCCIEIFFSTWYRARASGSCMRGLPCQRNPTGKQSWSSYKSSPNWFLVFWILPCCSQGTKVPKPGGGFHQHAGIISSLLSYLITSTVHHFECISSIHTASSGFSSADPSAYLCKSGSTVQDDAGLPSLSGYPCYPDVLILLLEVEQVGKSSYNQV